MSFADSGGYRCCPAAICKGEALGTHGKDLQVLATPEKTPYWWRKMVKSNSYPLVNIQKTMENHHV